MTAHLFETPSEVIERAAHLLDPEAFDPDAQLPWGEKRWKGHVPS